MVSIIEKMFERGKEIQEILNNSTDKKQAVKKIMRKYSDISNSENAIASNLTQFKVLYPVIVCIRQKNEQLKAENRMLRDNVNSLTTEINILKTDNNVTDDNTISDLLNQNDVLNGKVNELTLDKNKIQTAFENLTAENRMLRDNVNSLTTEINILKNANCLLNKENAKLKQENEQLSINNLNFVKKINTKKQEQLPMIETKETGGVILEKLFSLESELNRLREWKNSLTPTQQAAIQKVKKEKEKFHSWNIITDKRGFKRIFKRIAGKTVGIFIGRPFDEDKAIKKITERGLPLD